MSARCISYLPTFVFVLLVAYVTAYQPYSNGPPIRSDGQGYHIWTFALKKWDFRFCEYRGLGWAEPGEVPGRCVVRWPPGVALLRFPVMVWFVNVHNHKSFSRGEHWVSLLFGAGLTLGIYGLGLSTLRRIKVDPLEAQAILFLLFFGTGLFHYGTYDSSYSHVYSAFGSAILVWQLSRLQDPRDTGARWWDPWLTAVVAFFMILFRNTNVLILLFYSALALQSRTLPTKRRLLGGLCLGSCVAVAIQLSYNWYATGHFALSSYVDEPFLWDEPMIGSVLLSYERGLFTYYPVVLFALALGLARRGSRPFTSALLLLVLLYAALYGFWHSWFLGGGFGHRGFVDLVPLMIPAVGLSLADIDDLASRRWILAAASLTLLIPLQVMIGYWRGTFPFQHPDKTVYWAHVSHGSSGVLLVAGVLALFVLTDRLRAAAKAYAGIGRFP